MKSRLAWLSSVPNISSHIEYHSSKAIQLYIWLYNNIRQLTPDESGIQGAVTIQTPTGYFDLGEAAIKDVSSANLVNHAIFEVAKQEELWWPLVALLVKISRKLNIKVIDIKHITVNELSLKKKYVFFSAPSCTFDVVLLHQWVLWSKEKISNF